MLRFGHLIKAIQRHQDQKDHHVFFMAENVVIDNDRDKPWVEGTLERIKDAFAIDWSIVLDALYFSPVRRKRTFLSNIPLSTKISDYFEEGVSTSCLREGYRHLANIKRPRMIVKANCFMASISRVNDDRMIVLKPTRENEYTQRCINTEEREDMMGYPKDYVKTPGMSFGFACEAFML